MQKQKIEYRYIFLVLIISLFSTANAYCTTLNEAINTLYKNNQKLSADKTTVKESKVNFAAQILSALPDVNYSEDLMQRDTVIGTAGTIMKKDTPNKRTTGLYQDISMGSVFAGPLVASRNLAFEKERFHVNEQNIILEGINAYLNVIAQDEILKVAKENLDISEKTLKLVQSQFKLGDTTKTQVEYAMSNLQTRKSTLIRSTGDSVAAKAEYEKIFGILPQNLSIPTKLPELPKTFKEFEAIAGQNNPTMRARYARKQISKAQIAAQTNAVLPRLALSYNKVTNDNILEIVERVKTEKVFQLALRIPLIPHGGSEYAKIISSKFAFNRENALYAYSLSELREQVLSGWENITIAQADLEAAQAAQKYAKLAADSMQKEFEYGSVTMIDLLEAERRYFDASIKLIQIRNNSILIVYKVLAIMGKLNQSLFIR